VNFQASHVRRDTRSWKRPWRCPLRAQQPGKMTRVGFFLGTGPPPRRHVLCPVCRHSGGLDELGYVEAGTSSSKRAGGRALDQLPALAAELWSQGGHPRDRCIGVAGVGAGPVREKPHTRHFARLLCPERATPRTLPRASITAHVACLKFTEIPPFYPTCNKP